MAAVIIIGTIVAIAVIVALYLRRPGPAGADRTSTDTAVPGPEGARRAGTVQAPPGSQPDREAHGKP